ncbi:hypothetical protein D3C87_2067700 [compost metagenome]
MDREKDWREPEIKFLCVQAIHVLVNLEFADRDFSERDSRPNEDSVRSNQIS